MGRRTALSVATGAVLWAAHPARAQQSQAATKSARAPTAQERAALDGLITADMLDDPASPILGNPTGDVSMVEFFDYRCPYCKIMAPRLVKLLDADRGLRLVMKEYPILSRESVIAAQVALVAARHEKYAAFHAAMYALSGPFDEAKILDVAQSVGLDPATARKERDDSEVLGEIRRNLALGEIIGVKGTPAFIVGGQVVPGAVSIDVLETLIRDARQRYQKKVHEE